MILAGAIPAALLAILFDFLLSRVQRLQTRKLHQAAVLLPLLMLVFSSFYILPVSGKKLMAGFTPEFMGREDGYLGLLSKYDLQIPNVVISDAVMYKAAYEKKLDVISGYSTDGRLKAFDLVTLEDDKVIFPPYYAAPLVRSEILQQYPQLLRVLNLLAGRINDSIMTDLNYQVDYQKKLPEQVAQTFLVKNGLYKAPRGSRQGTIRLGSKIFAEQYILVHIYRMLIEGNTDLKVELKTGLGGTKICFDALVNNGIDLYPEYTGTGLLVLLQPDAKKVQQLIGSRDSVYAYVKEEFQHRYNLMLLLPIGFNNAYALMMRRRQAQELQLKTISDLKSYLDQP
jgi:osmoprotectant transport system permease protein